MMIDKIRLINDLKLLHKKIAKVYLDIFTYKLEGESNFANQINSEYIKEGISKIEDKKKWNEKYIHRSAYTLLNKILFIRICEDKGFMVRDNKQDYSLTDKSGQKLSKIGLQKWTRLIKNYSLSELVRFAFRDMNQSYNNISLYKEDLYDWLIPNKDDIDLKYTETESFLNTPYRDFEFLIEEIIELLDTTRYDFCDSADNVLGDVYEKFMDRDTRKSLGQFYTPDFVIKNILENTLSQTDIVKNPFIKILDPACGSGHFLIMAYDILKQKFESNISLLQEVYATEEYQVSEIEGIKKILGQEYWVTENIHYHILKNCIYGADIDIFAIQLTTINLLLKDLEHFSDELNIVSCNSLFKWEKEYDWEKLKYNVQGSKLFTFDEGREQFLDYDQVELLVKNGEFWSNKFDFIVGNPPYVGQKGNKAVFEFFKTNENWKEFYERKQDLYYYFIVRGLEKLKEDGKLAYIMPPYWLTAFATTKLKKVIKENSNLVKVFDFKGYKVFDDAQINGGIFIFEKKKKNENSAIEIYEFNNSETQFNYYNSRFTNNNLDFGMWNIFDSNENEDLFNKVNSKKLEDIANISPGIQTGSDRVSASHIKKLGLENVEVSEGIFVLSKKELEQKHFSDDEMEFVKPFYKNSMLEKYCSGYKTEEYFIITNNIQNISDYPNLKKHLLRYKIILDARYRNFALINADKEGKWYYLYGYRPNTNFEGEKIVTPYRSKGNRFSFSSEPLYGSIDIFYIDIFDKNFSIFYVLGILNSDLILYWLQKNCKKKGENLELYAEPLGKIPIPNSSDTVHYRLSIEKYTRELINMKNNFISNTNKQIDEIITKKNIYEKYLEFKEDIVNEKVKLSRLQEEINNLVYKLFNISKEEQNRVLDYLAVKGLTSTFEDELCTLDNPYLHERLKITLLEKIIVYLSETKEQTSTTNILNYLKNTVPNFEEVIEVLKFDNLSLKSSQLINKILTDNSDSIKQFIKKKTELKPTKSLIKYDNNIFGLTEWSDEVHKKFLVNAIEFYISQEDSNLNDSIFYGLKKSKKKAIETIEILTELDFAEKDDYIELLTEKVNKAFD